MPSFAKPACCERVNSFTSGIVIIPGIEKLGIPMNEDAVVVPTPPLRGSSTMSAASALSTRCPPRPENAMPDRGQDVLLVDAVDVLLFEEHVLAGQRTEVDLVERLVDGGRKQQLLGGGAGSVRRLRSRATGQNGQEQCGERDCLGDMADVVSYETR